MNDSSKAMMLKYKTITYLQHWEMLKICAYWNWEICEWFYVSNSKLINKKIN